VVRKPLRTANTATHPNRARAANRASHQPKKSNEIAPFHVGAALAFQGGMTNRTPPMTWTKTVTEKPRTRLVALAQAAKLAGETEILAMIYDAIKAFDRDGSVVFASTLYSREPVSAREVQASKPTKPVVRVERTDYRNSPGPVSRTTATAPIASAPMPTMTAEEKAAVDALELALRYLARDDSALRTMFTDLLNRPIEVNISGQPGQLALVQRDYTYREAMMWPTVGEATQVMRLAARGPIDTNKVMFQQLLRRPYPTVAISK
jgi:hypothetical protein